MITFEKARPSGGPVMADTIRGPLRMLPGEGGPPVPFYVVPFDKAGSCTGPRTRDHLLGAAADATDVFLFSHGWNSEWAGTIRKYERFVEHFRTARRNHWNPPDRDYRPVLAGIFWPSAALVAEGDRGPDIAADGAVADPEARPDELTELDVVADAFAGAPPARLYELAEQDTLTGGEARELAEILAPVLAGGDDEIGGEAGSVSADDLLEIWSRLPAGAPDVGSAGTAPADPGGFIDDAPDPAAASSRPATAGLLDALNPRNVIRTATVLLMKDRAGKVGGHGVADLLRGLLAASATSRVHLVGHSYGCKVVLSALANGQAPVRDVESVLLLQPATSALCFARDVEGGRPGGYRVALERTRQPIVTTFSRHDVPLTKLFHLAARRASDLGEAVIAGEAPSKFAALGGFGPQGVTGETATVTARSAPDRYDLAARPERRIVAVRADDVIPDHGSVESHATAWALLCQTMS